MKISALKKACRSAAEGVPLSRLPGLAVTAAAVVSAGALPLLLLRPGVASVRKRAPFQNRNYAHRGLHSVDRQVPENSLAAFRAAAAAGYGMELDVQLSRDGRVVVFHDDTLERVCGVEGRVEDQSWDALRRLRLCGTEERIPLFSEVLAAVDGAVPLIVELKSGSRNRELCEKTRAMLDGYRGDACVESFHPGIVAWFRFHAPEYLRGQLAMPAGRYVNAGHSRASAFVLGNTFCNFLAKPEFIAYALGPRPLAVRTAERMGAMRFGWTSHNPAAEKGRDAVIFEYYRPAARYRR